MNSHVDWNSWCSTNNPTYWAACESLADVLWDMDKRSGRNLDPRTVQ